MSGSQRAILLSVPLLMMLAFGFLFFRDSQSSYVSLSLGKDFTTEEVIHAEEVLLRAGLIDFSRKGQRIMVPQNEVPRYNAALIEGGGLPTDWASEWQEQFEKSSMFVSKDQLQVMRDIALGNQLRRMIRAIPAIEDASVMWARSKKRLRWNNTTPEVTATVMVKPRPGQELTPVLVTSLRAAVSTMVPDLSTDSVTVFDQSTGTSYTAGDKNDAFDSKFISWVNKHTKNYQDKILDSLSYIPDVIVNVNVDVENLKRYVERKQEISTDGSVTLQSKEQSTERSLTEKPTRAEPGARSNQPNSLSVARGNEKNEKVTETNNEATTAPSFTWTEKEFVAAMPSTVQVSVSIPEDYYSAVAVKRGIKKGEAEADLATFKQATTAIQTEVETSIQKQVQRLIPSQSAEDAVSVASYVRIDAEVPELELPLTESVGEFVSQWGSTIGLGLFAIWALWMLNKSMPQMEEIKSEEIELPQKRAAASNPDEEAEKPKKEPTQRDEVQLLVRDNPEVAAMVLSKWIHSKT
ncbi:flagellar MS-ring protein [Gimesia algae]|uniref:Flagellar MS-ring protein n=2 Tax=Gimesia algae TaxID=2527971 RepID=A0A517V9Q1_9PLAN|nr:flagellar MS-ring protein [Gimesia algae]